MCNPSESAADQAVIDVAGFPGAGENDRRQFVGPVVGVGQQAVPGQVSVRVITQRDRRRQQRQQAVGHGQPAGGDHGGELVQGVGEGEAARHGPGEVVINGRGLPVDRQAGHRVGQRAGHRQHIVVEKHVGQPVYIISLEALLQGVTGGLLTFFKLIRRKQIMFSMRQ